MKYAVVVALLLVSGCGVPHQTPQLVIADGQIYGACQDILWVSSNSGLLGGETTYDIKFTDGGGSSHDIRGIRHLEISDLPDMIPSPLPTDLPDPKTDTDRSGKPYVEGVPYTWSDGSSAVLKDGKWQPVARKNPLCQPPTK